LSDWLGLTRLYTARHAVILNPAVTRYLEAPEAA